MDIEKLLDELRMHVESVHAAMMSATVSKQCHREEVEVN